MHNKNECNIISKVTFRRVQQVKRSHELVSRALTGELQLSITWKEFIVKEVAFV